VCLMRARLVANILNFDFSLKICFKYITYSINMILFNVLHACIVLHKMLFRISHKFKIYRHYF
jgi:hypothetical protein